MEKMIWVKPELNEVAFAANEYVAACGEKYTVYKFICNAGTAPYQDYGNWLNPFDDVYDSYPYTVYKEDGSLQAYNFKPCNATHEASTQDSFFKGYIDHQHIDEKIDVMIWTDGGTDTHCTDKIDMNTWETAKS